MRELRICALIAVSFVITYGLFVFLKVLDFMKTYTFGYDVGGINTDAHKKIGELLSGKKSVSFVVSIWIKNASMFLVRVQKLKIKFYHNGNYIGFANSPKSILIGKNQKSNFDLDTKLFFNNEMISLFFTYAKENVKIDYVATFQLYGIPVTLTSKGFHVVKK